MQNTIRSVVYNKLTSKPAIFGGRDDIRVILSRGGDTLLNMTTGEITGRELMVRAVADDLAGIKRGDVIAISGADYYVLTDPEVGLTTGMVTFHVSRDEVIA